MNQYCRGQRERIPSALKFSEIETALFLLVASELRCNTHTQLVIPGGKCCRNGHEVDHLTAYCPMYLQALSTDSIERLPVYNKTVLKNYKVSQKADDWCIPSKEPLDLSNFKMAK